MLVWETMCLCPGETKTLRNAGRRCLTDAQMHTEFALVDDRDGHFKFPLLTLSVNNLVHANLFFPRNTNFTY